MTEGKMGSVVLSVLLTAAWVHAAVPDIGSRRELFVDECLVETMTGCELRLHHPIPREVALVHGAPWEGNLSCFHTVFKDGELYRMYYRGTQLDCARGSRKKHVDVTSRTWRNDAVEFAFSPDLKSRYHLIMNAAGEIYDAVDGNARWNASATVAVGKNAAENTWTVEVALPWRDLGVEPACGMICRGNLGRENMTQGGAKWFENNECSSWCKVVTGGLNSPGSMGVFILE